MKIDDIYKRYQDLQQVLKISDLENTFELTVDEDGKYVYNLNETLYLDIPDSELIPYTCTNTMYWPLISYKLYGTTRLAWFLMKINNVLAEDAFKPKYAGDIVYHVDRRHMENVISIINDFDE